MNLFSRIAKLMETGQAVALVTVVAVDGPAPREPGVRFLVFPDGRIEGTIGGGALEQRAIQDALALFASGERTLIRNYELIDLGMLCGGRATLFYELLSPNPRLVIFGAGHVGMKLAELAQRATPFAVELYDDRPEREGFAPEVNVRHLPNFAELPALNGQTYVVICTDSHATDLMLAQKALAVEPPPAYVGMLGSRVKAEEFRRRLMEAGVAKERVQILRCPVGLPIGGKDPGAVAISILAEILAFHHGRLNEARERLDNL